MILILILLTLSSYHKTHFSLYKNTNKSSPPKGTGDHLANVLYGFCSLSKPQNPDQTIRDYQNLANNLMEAEKTLNTEA